MSPEVFVEDGCLVCGVVTVAAGLHAVRVHPMLQKVGLHRPSEYLSTDKTLWVIQGRPSSTLRISVSQTKPSVLYKVGLHPL